MADERDEIRSRIDIVQLVGREIQLKKAGKTWKGLCPFHPDKNPSFTVSSETGRYKCWSCGEGGDIFTWEMKRRNVDFVEAMQTLAREAGVELSNKPGVPASVRQQQHGAMDEALKFFRQQLERSVSAKQYCERRGLDAEGILKWEIGYAPDVGDALATHLKKAGYVLSDCKSLFLVDQDAQGGYYDKFRGRLMFPIRDEKGQLVAFGGRVLGDGTPKYINSSDTPLYRKSKVLYGMFQGRDAISKVRHAVLVEGYLDVIACHLASVGNAVASLGTALSEDHAKLLSRWCDEVIILYDSDDAGKKAAERAVEVLRGEGVRVRVALMPQGDDPDTLLKRGGPVAVQEAVVQALTPIEYRLQILRRNKAYDDEEFWTQAVEILAQAASPAELDRHIAEIAGFYPWQRNPVRAAGTLRRQVLALRGRDRSNAITRPAILSEHHALKGLLSSAEIVLFRCALGEQYRDAAWRFVIASDLFETAFGEKISAALAATFGTSAPIGPSSAWLSKIPEEDIQQTLSDLTLDFRAENLSEEKLFDSVKRLHTSREERRREKLKSEGVDRAKLFELLKAEKVDTRKPKKDKDTLF